MKGIIAPPQIPVMSIPEKEPWCFDTEFNANDIMIGYITAAKKPTAGKQYNAIVAPPNKDMVNAMIAKLVKNTNIFRLSNIFTSNKPTTVPAVIIPQNQETT